MNARVRAYIKERVEEIDQISKERKAVLHELADYVQGRLNVYGIARLTFICTHNSRRSHLSQIWAQVAAHHFGIFDVESFSGGTEATSFNPRAVAALQRVGFPIRITSDDSNPLYEVSFSENLPPFEAFSKVYDQPPNPTSDFCAVMTCTDADRGCPVIVGATCRVSIPYQDPKDFDGTDLETAKYDERCRQISREMLYAFSLVKQ